MPAKAHLAGLQTLAERFSPWKASATFEQVRKGLSDKDVTLTGWLHRRPRQISKGLLFAVLRSPQGDLIQVVDSSEPSKLRKLKPDSVVSIRGSAVAKLGEDSQKEPVFDVHISDLRIHSEADGTAGSLVHEVKEWPLEKRYIQLRQPPFQKILRKRSAIVKQCRDILSDSGFTEVETPLLFKSTPEGAREFLVPTRKKGRMYALPQSPQQYKQLLIASGIDRYFQVAKCFRDEDLRQDRQPEFTQLDLEMGFAQGEDVRSVVENLVQTVWSSHASEPLTTKPTALSEPLPANPGSQLCSLSYSDAIAQYGIDKPDLRYPHTFFTLGLSAARHAEFTILEALRLSSADLATCSLEKVLRSDLYNSRVPLAVRYDHAVEDIAAAATHFNIDRNALESELLAKHRLEPGEVLLLSDRLGSHAGYENPTPLGRARQLLIEGLEAMRTADLPSVAVWMQQFPLFEPREVGMQDGYPVYDYDSLSATHHPFTMVMLENLPQLFSDPLSCQGQHFDLVVNGVELGGGSTRVHDAELQQKILNDVLKIPNSDRLFGHLLAALAAGCPPHAGLAIGLDRMIAMLCHLTSIKDVIAFPKTISGFDPVIQSPSKVTPDQLRPYHIQIR